MTLTQWLVERQTEQGLSGHAFARRLGMSPQLWHRYTRGDLVAGRALIAGALRLFPEEHDAIVRCVLVSSTLDTVSAAAVA